jgi:sec-independent protein translocase protein TatA
MSFAFLRTVGERSRTAKRQGVRRMNITGLLIVVIIGLVLFGSGKLPRVGSGLGKTIANFKRGLSEPEEIDITAKKKDQENGPKA